MATCASDRPGSFVTVSIGKGSRFSDFRQSAIYKKKVPAGECRVESKATREPAGSDAGMSQGSCWQRSERAAIRSSNQVSSLSNSLLTSCLY